jgi:hypothetical protein
MQQEQRSGLDLDGFYLDLRCIGVPVSAHKSVCDGCPPGCPPVSGHILPARPANLARQFPTTTKTIPTGGPDRGQASGSQHRPLASGCQSGAAAQSFPLMHDMRVIFMEILTG